MTKNMIGKTAVVTEGQSKGKFGIVTYQRLNSENLGSLTIEIDGKSETFPIEMTNLHNAPSLYCHYCGMPAKTFGFFDVPVCSDCGG